MIYLSIVDKDMVYCDLFALELKVLSENGFDMTPDVDINVTSLSEGEKNFTNNSGDGDSFNIEVYIENGEEWCPPSEVYDIETGELISELNGEVTDILNEWIKNMTVLKVTTNAMDIKNGEYIITDNSSRKQTHEAFSIWNLEFTRFTGVTGIEFKNTTTNAKKAVKKYEKIKRNNVLNSKLKKCNYKNMKYGKSNMCIHYLNAKLTLKGYIKSKQWNSMVKNKTTKKFSKTTKSAVKSWQTKYNKKHKNKITANGVLSKEMLQKLYSY